MVKMGEVESDMFRELLRKKQQLSTEECVLLLKQEKRGVLCVLGDEEYPYGMPMNHVYHEADGCIYFHCGREGHRVDALRRHEKVSFCVYDQGVREDGQWALRVRSVIVFGRIEIVDERSAVVEITTELCHKFTQDEQYIKDELERYARKTILLKLIPEHICGKLVTEA